MRNLPPFLARSLSAVLDPAILFSFDRFGYWLHQASFDRQDLQVDLRGRNCLVTGANSGIGFEVARQLAALGANVWLLCRNLDRGREAQDQIREAVPGARLHLEPVDVAERSSVHGLVERLPLSSIDVLVHNAGILPAERHETTDGLEATWATNVVGPFLLTQLLMPRLQASSDARVIWVSSGGIYPTRLNLDDVQSRREPFSGVQAYSLSKRAQVVLNELFQQRYGSERLTFAAMHPGWVASPGLTSSLPGFTRWMQSRLRTPAEGADTIVWLAACERIREMGGKFWFDRRPRWTHFVPWTRETSQTREELWRLCCEHAGLANC